MKLNKEDKKKLFWQKALKDEMQREWILFIFMEEL